MFFFFFKQSVNCTLLKLGTIQFLQRKRYTHKGLLPKHLASVLCLVLVKVSKLSLSAVTVGRLA